jgi:ribulose-5-phosphate 4-epimerase/fuculose-1-phosphate aldolase
MDKSTKTAPRGIAEAEWQARIQLAAAYRIFDHLGWTEMIYNHITLRVPGEEGTFLINPFGLCYDEVTASNLVKIDVHGNRLAGEHPVNPAGFIIHGAIHAALPDAHCVIHTHTTEGIAVACQENGLAADSFHSVILYKRVGYHDFEGITTNPGEQGRLLASIGSHRAVILRNHGLLTWGGSLPEAFLWMWHLQRACEIQVMSHAMGPVRKLPKEVCEKSHALLTSFNQQTAFGADVFAAMQRKIDRIAPSYRE